jgi:hypothetical protein
VVIFAALPLFAAAQQTPPSDQDLKAVYCLQVVTRWATTYQNSALHFPEGSEAQTFINGQTDQLLSDGHRLRSYILPKLNYLDPLALAAAVDRAKIDLSSEDEAMGACLNRCSGPAMDPRTEIGRAKGASCLKSCIAGNPLLARTWSCQSLDWLPL